MKEVLNLTLKLITGACLLLVTAAAPVPAPTRQSDNRDPPENTVKLIFIHHSTGENWLADGYGNLGRELAQNNYFVSDTNYGWGPDSIGDRTDIPNWTEWFASASTPIYINALFNESGQNSEYTRTRPDPGGENQIIMFKSCFPNSELEGNPNDPAGTYEEMSVSGAKYVYNTILQYFATRPDKLFIVITAPPVSNPEYGANARAFNNWLVNDWLNENNYTLNNVAVFDFYNVLTDKDAHHRIDNGQIEHIPGNRNTLAYPSDDDHPSERGSQKATDEFIPMLNVFYHRWQENAPLQPPPVPASPAGESPQPEPYPAQPPAVGLIDDFETDTPPGTNGWEPFWDASTPTSMHCTAEAGPANSGKQALLLDFEVPPGNWATCALFYENVQDWSGGEGLTFHLHAAQPGLVLDVDIYAGTPETQETYLYSVEAPVESVSGWVPVSLNWSDFRRADWEENAGAPFTNPERVLGMAFGFSTYEDAPNTGKLWVDDLSLLGNQPAPATPPSAEENPPAEAPEPSEPAGPSLPCGGAIALPLALTGLAWEMKKRR